MGFDRMVTVRGTSQHGEFEQRLHFTGNEFGTWYLNFSSVRATVVALVSTGGGHHRLVPPHEPC